MKKLFFYYEYIINIKIIIIGFKNYNFFNFFYIYYELKKL